MTVVILVLSGLLVATAGVALGVLYFRYRQTPAADWKRRVLTAAGEQDRRLRAARRELDALLDDAATRRLREDYLALQLRGISVEALADYPGIGPVTVGRLRAAGLTTVADCAPARLARIPGIGPVRHGDLKNALRNVRREAEARFDAGASREAVAFAEELKRREADRAGRIERARQAVREAEAGVAFLAEKARVAAGVTFVGHLFGRQSPGLTEDLLNAPLSPPPEPIPQPEPMPVGDQAPTPLAEPPTVLPSPPASGGEGPGVRGVESRGAEQQRPESATFNPPHPRLLSPRSGGRGENPGTAPSAVAAPAAPPPRPPAPPPPEPTPRDRLWAAAAFGLAVAKADGRIAAAERRQIQAFLRRRYAPTSDLADQIDAVLAQIEEDLPTLGDALWDVRRSLPAASWPDLYQFAQAVADASGERNAREIECLARVAEELDIGNCPPTAPPPPPAAVAPTAVPSADEPPSELQCRADLEIDPGGR